MELVFKALADQTRRNMLDKLLQSPGITLGELIEGTDMRRQSASKHVQILEEAGLVHVEWRGREKKHFLNPIPVREISRRWLDKYNEHQADALLSMKDALEETPENVRREQPQVKRGPEVTSFFTPIED
ncbi:MAG: helix-turn-helix transcriptional regulator [Kordiimonadaceae bacterium]|nr:helix-turn-helix transcriptional regulator [Kordiimonadaceae bacterium]MBO6567165.1 helix-turn-helix transcriptional regulator [Kordiimonadaceae bacterium]MBO6963620.1 helix-turn-helix transcriptional regulator [Kordiimonadaceae bacterium]